MGEWGPSSDCGGRQVGQVYEGALLGGFRWGCQRLRASPVPADGTEGGSDGQTAFGSECTIGSKPIAALSPN